MEHVISHKLESVKTDKFVLHFFNSLTNLKIILLTSQDCQNVKSKMLIVYTLYSDFVRNNWRYMSGQPIKSKEFQEDIDKIFQK